MVNLDVDESAAANMSNVQEQDSHSDIETTSNPNDKEYESNFSDKIDEERNEVVANDNNASMPNVRQDQKTESHNVVDDEEIHDENVIAATSLDDIMENESNVVDDILEERNKGDIGDIDHKSTEATSTTNAVMNSNEISNSWTRNFSTPLLAVVDLLDNALDATTLTNRGRIYIERDFCIEQAATTTCKFIPEQTTGLIIWNNSFTPIRPLHEVMNGSNDYGMALKHGCLSLSKSSFFLVKSNSTQYSLGVIRQKTENGRPSILDFTFKSSNMDDLKREIFLTFILSKTENQIVNECLVRYGLLMHGHKSDNVDCGMGAIFRLGIDRLIEKYQKMNQNGWEIFPHTCCLIIDHIKHDYANQQTYVNTLLDTLYEDLPKRYLHLPSTSILDVRVNGHIVNFNYWQPRLVEMSQFYLKIHKSAKITDLFNATAAGNIKFFSMLRQQETRRKNDNDEDDEKSNNDEDVPSENGSSKIFVDNDPSQVYTLRIYIGFDALRVCGHNSAAMYVYSGQSGRLIKSILDCKIELGLGRFVTDNWQGLTLIVDDYHGKFPLILTKEDLGFHGEQHGETHQQNLYMWLSAAVRMHYKYYKYHVCDKQKRKTGNMLTKALRALQPKVQQLIQRSSTSFQPLSNCKFTSFGVFTSNSLSNYGLNIKLLPIKFIECYTGKDTILRLPVVDPGDNEDVDNKDQLSTKNSGKKSNNNNDETSHQSKKKPPPISDSQLDKDQPNTIGKKSKNNDKEKSRKNNQSKKPPPPPHNYISVLSDNDSDSETYDLSELSLKKPTTRDNSQTRKHKKANSISERLLLESNRKSIENLHKKLAMENENRQLIQKLAKETSALLAEVSKQTVLNKKLQLHVKEIQKKKNTKSQYSDEDVDDEISLSSAENKANSKKRKRITRSSSINQVKKNNRSPYLDDDDDGISLSSSETANSKKRKRITTRSSKNQTELKLKTPMSNTKTSGRKTSTPDKLYQVGPKRRNATTNSREYITGMYKHLNPETYARIQHLDRTFMVETAPPLVRTKWNGEAQQEQLEQTNIKAKSLDKREQRKSKRDAEIISYIKHDSPLMYDRTKEVVLARSHALSEYLQLDQYRADVKNMNEETFAIVQDSLWKHIKAMICVSQKGWLLDVTHHANNVVPFTKHREWVYDLHFTRWKNDNVHDHKFPLVEWLKVHESTKVMGKLGVFACRRFAKGEVIAIFGGHHIVDTDDSDISRYAMESKDYGIYDPKRGLGDCGSDAPYMAMQHVIEVSNTSEVNAKMLSNFLVEATRTIEIDEEIYFNHDQSTKRVVSRPPVQNKKHKNVPV